MIPLCASGLLHPDCPKAKSTCEIRADRVYEENLNIIAGTETPFLI